MTLSDMLRQLVGDVTIALAQGLAALVESQDLDQAYATTIEKLSDVRLQRKNFPDGKYVPPT